MAGLKLLSALIIFCLTLFSGLYPYYRHRCGQVACPIRVQLFACGVLLGAGSLDLLPAAQVGFQHLGIHFPLALMMTIGLLGFLLLVDFIQARLCRRPDTAVVVFMAFLLLSLHSFLMGCALGLGARLSMVSLIFFAIVVHKWAASFSLAGKFFHSSFSNKMSVSFIIFFALMTPLGIVLGDVIADSESQMSLITPIMFSIGAGTLIYLGGVHDFLGWSRRRMTFSKIDFLFLILGFMLIVGSKLI